jgi:hypothetical protein
MVRLFLGFCRRLPRDALRQQRDNAPLCALKVERGRTIQTEHSHAMQNAPEVVQQGISIDGRGYWPFTLDSLGTSPECQPIGSRQSPKFSLLVIQQRRNGFRILEHR